MEISSGLIECIVKRLATHENPSSGAGQPWVILGAIGILREHDGICRETRQTIKHANFYHQQSIKFSNKFQDTYNSFT